MAKHKAKADEAKSAPQRRSPRWQVVVVPKVVRCEAREFLTKGQYLHVADLVSQLCGFGMRTYDSTLWIEPFGNFWELKEKGGVLGRINVRVYFDHLADRNEVVVLHAYKKEDDGAAPPYVHIRVKNRLKLYLAGELSEDATRHERPSEV